MIKFFSSSKVYAFTVFSIYVTMLHGEGRTLLSPVTPSDLKQGYSYVSTVMRKNQAIKVGFVVTALGVSMGGLWYIFSPGVQLQEMPALTSSHPSPHIRLIFEQLKKNTEILKEDQSLREQLLQMAGGIGSWKKFFINQALSAVVFSLIGGALNPFSKYFKRLDEWVDNKMTQLFNEGTIDWFVVSHTHLAGLLDMVKRDSIQNFQGSCATSWLLFKKDFVNLIAFIHYKKSAYSKDLSSIAHRFDVSIQKMLKAFEHARVQLELVLQENKEKDTLKILDDLKVVIDTAVQECALIESLHFV